MAHDLKKGGGGGGGQVRWLMVQESRGQGWVKWYIVRGGGGQVQGRPTLSTTEQNDDTSENITFPRTTYVIGNNCGPREIIYSRTTS